MHSQRTIALLNCISARPLLTEPIGVSVSGGLRDWVQSKQVESLHGAVLHRGDGGFIMHLPLCALRIWNEYGLSCGPSPEVLVRLFRLA